MAQPEGENKEFLKLFGEKLAILDAGAQYGKVIDRRVRGLRVESEILPMNTPAKDLRKYKAIIISGGPQSVYSETAPKFDPEIFFLGKPILGICYGMQLINQQMGGIVERKKRREDGPCDVVVDSNSVLFKGLEASQEVLMSHGDSIGQLAPGFRAIADSNGITAAIENPERNLFGVQFHPEVDLTKHGRDILSSFLFEIAGFLGDFTMESRQTKAISYIREIAGDKKVLTLVSGGVDSTVCATLLNEALGPERVLAVHVDNGFMRLNESLEVQAALEALGLKLTVVDASADFYNAVTVVDGRTTPKLSEITDPELKRKIIGDTFMKVAEGVMLKFGLDSKDFLLAQGTLRPDLIESASRIASSNADVIKTHHNDTALVRALRTQGRIIEPLRDYHKDEVRELGKSLGLPDSIVWRQPFPGPGLAIRVICADRPFIDKDFEETERKLSAFASSEIVPYLLPIRTVGVQGDERSYSYLVGLTGKKDWGKLFRLAREIPKGIHRVNRIVYLFGERTVGSFNEITPTHLTKDVIEQLRKADTIVNQILQSSGLIERLSQVPVISFPMGFGKHGQRSIGIRTFITNDFMTGVPAIPGKDISEEVLMRMVSRILSEVSGISRVAYDLTSKPPGTTEWE